MRTSIKNILDGKRGRNAALLTGVVVALGVAAGPANAASVNIHDGALTGGGASATGSWLKLYADGNPSAALTNGSSVFTPLHAGTADGLNTGTFQGYGAIVTPENFFGVPFDVNTQSADLSYVGGKSAAAPYSTPSLTWGTSALTGGDVGAWSIRYGTALTGYSYYNQGADYSGTIATDVLTGTKSGSNVTLEWTSDILANYSGDFFDGYTGLWHIEGDV
ncbi:hypothetical protein AB0L40_06870 [Patulibacter sp. NPDC049589]|uniref:hypothetical protein n=1 Tax=Patulibacter sp. NPDC049589 TaxID=3154731 RepID=UPI00343B7D04